MDNPNQPGEAAVAENQPQAQQPQNWGSIIKGLAMRALFIYFITSFFRGSKPPLDPNSGPAGSNSGQKILPSSNLYPNGTIFDFYLYVSENEAKPDFNDTRELAWRKNALIYGDWYSGPEGDGQYSSEYEWPVSKNVQNNGSFWLHTYIVRHGDSPDESSPDFSSIFTLHKTFQLNKFKKRSYKKTHNLLTGETAQSKETQEKIEQNIKHEILSHWHPNLTINFITDQTMWTRGAVPAQLQDQITFEAGTNNYRPIIFMNSYWNLARDYLPLNDTVKTITFRFTYQPMSFMKFQFYMAQSMRNQWANIMGGEMMEQSDDEQDVLKETFLETSPILLALTVIVSITHSIFEFLAFKNDIQFWKERKSLEGLSVRSVFFNVFQSFIVLLYVLDNDTNIIVRCSIGVGLLIELWKIKKVVNIEIKSGEKIYGVFPKIVFSDKGSYVESATKEYDQMAFKYLSWLLFPLLLAYGVYSLMYNEHKGWYSFLLNMIYSFLITFGFIMMTPQLFINYKLKSVAHLPWRMLTYKFLNTFIDDIFAFVIKVPTMYRLSCFRDDIIFLIYLYQRWVYRVDHSRVNEFGISGDDIKEAEKHAIEESKKDK